MSAHPDLRMSRLEHFSKLSLADLAAIIDIGRVRSAPQGEWIFGEGEPCAGLYVLLDPLYGLLVFVGLLFDVVVYTFWLKRRSPWSIVWGGAAFIAWRIMHSLPQPEDARPVLAPDNA